MAGPNDLVSQMWPLRSQRWEPQGYLPSAHSAGFHLGIQVTHACPRAWPSTHAGHCEGDLLGALTRYQATQVSPRRWGSGLGSWSPSQYRFPSIGLEVPCGMPLPLALVVLTSHRCFLALSCPHPAESAFSRRVEGKAQNHFEETNSSSQNSSGECAL